MPLSIRYLLHATAKQQFNANPILNRYRPGPCVRYKPCHPIERERLIGVLCWWLVFTSGIHVESSFFVFRKEKSEAYFLLSLPLVSGFVGNAT